MFAKTDRPVHFFFDLDGCSGTLAPEWFAQWTCHPLRYNREPFGGGGRGEGQRR